MGAKPRDKAPSIVYRGTEKKWQLRLQGARELCARVGHDLVAAFLKCFEGVNRVLALEHLMVFNARSLPPASVAGERNLRVLVFFAASTLYELGAGLQQLCNMRVVDKMNDKSAWAPVNKLRKVWVADKRLKTLRNTFGFHLGELDHYRAGIAARLAASDTQLYARGEGRKRHGSDYVFPFDALLAGAKIEDDWVQAVAEMAWQAQTELPDQLHAVWVEVLRTAGVHIESE
jgi:hypothetical protein